MDSKLSRRIALALLEADSVEDVQEVLNDSRRKSGLMIPSTGHLTAIGIKIGIPSAISRPIRSELLSKSSQMGLIQFS